MTFIWISCDVWGCVGISLPLFWWICQANVAGVKIANWIFLATIKKDQYLRCQQHFKLFIATIYFKFFNSLFVMAREALKRKINEGEKIFNWEIKKQTKELETISYNQWIPLKLLNAQRRKVRTETRRRLVVEKIA